MTNNFTYHHHRMLSSWLIKLTFVTLCLLAVPISFTVGQPCPTTPTAGNATINFASGNTTHLYPSGLPAGVTTGYPNATNGNISYGGSKEIIIPLTTVVVHPEWSDGTMGWAIIQLYYLSIAESGGIIKVYDGEGTATTPVLTITSANADTYYRHNHKNNGPITVTFENTSETGTGNFDVGITYMSGEVVATSPFGTEFTYWKHFITPNSHSFIDSRPGSTSTIATGYFDENKNLVSSELSWCIDYGQSAPRRGNIYPGQLVFYPTARPDINEDGNLTDEDRLKTARLIYILQNVPQPITDPNNFSSVRAAVDMITRGFTTGGGELGADAIAAITSLPSPAEPTFSITAPATPKPAGSPQNFVVDLIDDGGHPRIYTLEIPSGVSLNSVTGSGISYNAVDGKITFATSATTAIVSVTSASNQTATVRVIYDQPGFWNVDNLVIYEPCDYYNVPGRNFQGFLGLSKGEIPHPHREASATWFDEEQPDAFPCSGEIYYQIVDGNSLYEYQMDGSRTLISSFPTSNINAISYNEKDNLIWGVDRATNELIKIGSDGAIVRYTIPGLTTTLSAINVGTADLDGHLYLYESAASSYITVDIDPASSTYLQIVDPTDSFTAKTSAPWGTATTGRSISDWAYNPTDNKIYGLVDSHGGSPRSIVQLDPLTGVSSLSAAVTGAGIETSTAFGSGFIDANGNFLVFDNGTGRLFNISISSTTATLVATSSSTGNNDGAFCGSAIYTPLPVSLISFELSRENRSIALNWVTTHEKDNSGFEIERSPDATNWVTLGFVKGVPQNQLAKTNNYMFTDANPLNKINYYRLKQIDLSGQYEYSGIRSLRTDYQPETILYPNPSAGTFRLKNSTDEQTNLEIFDLIGNRLKTVVGIQNEKVDLSSLPSGLYIAKIIQKDGTYRTTKITVIK